MLDLPVEDVNNLMAVDKLAVLLTLTPFGKLNLVKISTMYSL
jgi:hypothetical protein